MIWKDYIAHISVSQLRTHDRNPRRWALEKILKLPTAGSPYTKIGSDIHEDLEDYFNGLVSGETTTPRPLSSEFIQEWEDLNDLTLHDIGVERKIDLQLAEDVPPFVGYIDLVVPEGPGGHPVVIDHKTSRTRRYFVKEGAMHLDWQMLVYAKWALEQWPSNSVWLQQNQFAYGLKKAKLQVVRVLVSKDHVEERMKILAQEIRKGIVETVKEFDSGTLPCTQKCGSCKFAFGPNSCEFAPICDGDVSIDVYKERMDELLSRDKDVYIMDVLDALDDTPMFTNLTENGDCDIIDTKEGEDTMPSIMGIEAPMQKARDKFNNVTNTWDRREAMTKAVVAHIVKAAPDLVLLPSHMTAALDPDYMPIVSQLKENNILVAIRT